MVKLSMGVVNPHGMFWSGDIVAQDQVQLILSVPHPGNGRDGIVRLPFRLGKNKGRLVRIAPPYGKDLFGKVHQPVVIPTAQAQDGQRPVDNACRHILKAAERHLPFHRSLLHGEGISPALEVIVAEDGTAHDGQIRVGTHKVMGELLHKVQQLPKSRPVDLHRHMPAVEHDAMLIVVDIGRILKEPAAVVDGDGDDPVVSPGRVVHPARVALVFPAQLAFGIAALGRGLGGGDGPGVLFRLGKVYGNIQIAVLRGSYPLHILGDAVAADVVRILAELIVPVCRRLFALGAAALKFADDLAGPRRQDTHEPGIQQIPAGDIVPDDPPLHSAVQQLTQDLLQGDPPQNRLRLLIAVQSQRRQKLIARPHPVRLVNKAVPHAILHQCLDIHAYVLHFVHFLTPISRRPQSGPTAHDTVHHPEPAPSRT